MNQIQSYQKALLQNGIDGKKVFIWRRLRTARDAC